MKFFTLSFALLFSSLLPVLSIAAPTYCPELEAVEIELPLVIGIKFSPPFVMGPKSALEGLSIDLWHLVADCLTLDENDYRFEEYGTSDGLIKATQKGKIDLSIAALSVTAEREALIDFTHSYFEASLGTLVAQRDSAANFSLVVAKILRSNLLNIIFGLLSFMFVVAVYYWWTERKTGNELFTTGPLRGFYRALIWATLLVFQGRGDPLSLNTRFGQLFVLFLMFFGVTIVSSFTAVITSSLTLQALEPEVKTVADLSSKTISVKASSTVAVKWAQDAGLFAEAMQTFPQVQRKFDDGEIDVFIHDREILQYLVNTKALVDVKLAPLTMEPQDYAIALPEGSQLREAINQSILSILDDPVWQTYKGKYLGNN